MTTSHILQLLWGAGASFLILTVIFWPLERLHPAKPGQPFFRQEWFIDLTFFLGQYLLWNGLVLSVLMLIKGECDAVMPAAIRAWVVALPWWAQAASALLLSDLGIYWGHRLQHRYDWLWRFHAVHHSSEHLDWLAAHREHPVDTIYTTAIINLPAFLLGFPIETLAGLVAFRGMWAIFIHSNVRLPLGPLRLLLGSPDLHHWHHDRDRHGGNYANLSPLMDVIFGTHYAPPGEPRAYGLSEPFPRSYLGQMIHPFLPRKRRAKKAEPAPSVVEPAVADLGRVEPVQVQVETCAEVAEVPR